MKAIVERGAVALGAGAASLFLLSPDGSTLQGALVGWDWTRTSFPSDLEEWPTVRAAIERNEAQRFTRDEARRSERGWFEPRGIESTVCAPMAAAGRVVGVLFFDDTAPSAPADLAVAKRAADECAPLVRHAAARLHAA